MAKRPPRTAGVEAALPARQGSPAGRAVTAPAVCAARAGYVLHLHVLIRWLMVGKPGRTAAARRPARAARTACPAVRPATAPAAPATLAVGAASLRPATTGWSTARRAEPTAAVEAAHPVRTGRGAPRRPTVPAGSARPPAAGAHAAAPRRAAMTAWPTATRQGPTAAVAARDARWVLPAAAVRTAAPPSATRDVAPRTPAWTVCAPGGRPTSIVAGRARRVRTGGAAPRRWIARAASARSGSAGLPRAARRSPAPTRPRRTEPTRSNRRGWSHRCASVAT